MPPDTPTTTVRPRSMGLLEHFLVVVERHLAVDRALERGRGDLAHNGLAGAARPLVEAARLAGGDDRQLVLAGTQGRNQRSKFRHDSPLDGEAVGFTARPGARARPAAPRHRGGLGGRGGPGGPPPAGGPARPSGAIRPPRVPRTRSVPLRPPPPGGGGWRRTPRTPIRDGPRPAGPPASPCPP